MVKRRSSKQQKQPQAAAKLKNLGPRTAAKREQGLTKGGMRRSTADSRARAEIAKTLDAY